MELRVRSFIYGFATCVLLVACAGSKFHYKYYPYDKVNRKLIGKDDMSDLNDTFCDSTDFNKFPCTCMSTDEFYRLKVDNIQTHEELEECQRKGA